MAKTYTVSGESKTRPTDLPDGFTVEETESFVRRIGAYEDRDEAAVTLTESDKGVLHLEFTANSDGYYFNKLQVGKLRNALTEWLGDAEIGTHSPEPDRSASYKDADGDVWTYDLELLGWRYRNRGGSFISSAYTWTHLINEFEGAFPWTLKV